MTPERLAGHLVIAIGHLMMLVAAWWAYGWSGFFVVLGWILSKPTPKVPSN